MPVICRLRAYKKSDTPSEVLTENTNLKTGEIKPKLPKLHLPKFSGKFQTFWDSFESAVHNNSGLLSINKFNYLKALLKGPTASTVLGLTLTEANYSTPVELLKEHFVKKQ